MRAKVLSTHTPALFEEAVAEASRLLRAGEVVAVPTETVYGLAANAWDAAAVRKIYEAKGRPAHNPLIVHVADGLMAARCAREWPEVAGRMTARFWPGPLTLVVPRGRSIPDEVTAGGDTVGLRWPFHPFMQAVIRSCGFPLAAPSANPANGLSPTCAAHVAAGLGDRIPLIVDGGDSNVGIESTVVDVTGPRPRVLRPGIISSEELADACGMPVDVGGEGGRGEGVLRSPGQLSKHYSPRTPLRLWRWRDEAELLRLLSEAGADPERTWIVAHQAIPDSGRFPNVIMIPADPEAYARALYGELHRCDAVGARLIVVEAVPDSPAWQGVADRLRRACVPG